jgi:hypothetical protein
MTQPSAQQGFNTKPLVFTIVLIFAVFFIAIAAYLKSGHADISSVFAREENSIKEIYSFNYDYKNQPVFNVYRDYIVRASREGVLFLDKKGQEVMAESATFVEPVIKVNGKYLLVADIGGREYYLFKDGKLQRKHRSNQEIYNCDLDKNGFVTLVTASNRYVSEVNVIDNYGIEMFKSVIANDYAISAKISPSGRQMAITGISTTGTQANSFIKFLDMTGVELSGAAINPQMGLAPIIFYASGDSLFAAGDSSITCFNSDREIDWQKNIKNISGACLVNNRRLAIASTEAGGTELKVFDLKGEKVNSRQINGKINNLTSFGRVIGVNSGRTAHFFNEKSEEIGIYNSKSEIKGIFFFNENSAILVNVNSVIVIEL